MNEEKDGVHGAWHALRALVFVVWWMAVAFAGVFVFYLMTRG